MVKETHKRSIIRSIIWRLIGVLVLAIVTWIFTRSLIQTSTITFLHHFVFIFVYYFHERLWQRIKIFGRKRTIIRIITYELILGQGILGIISLLITGSLQKMTFITICYIWNKLWIYAIYDYAWDRIKWGVLQENKD